MLTTVSVTALLALVLVAQVHTLVSVFVAVAALVILVVGAILDLVVVALLAFAAELLTPLSRANGGVNAGDLIVGWLHAHVLLRDCNRARFIDTVRSCADGGARQCTDGEEEEEVGELHVGSKLFFPVSSASRVPEMGRGVDVLYPFSPPL